MVKARLTQEEVEILDDNGGREQEKRPSAEYQLLKERGLQVLNVSIGGLRFSQEIEETIIRNWSATWLNNARQESDQVEKKAEHCGNSGAGESHPPVCRFPQQGSDPEEASWD